MKTLNKNLIFWAGIFPALLFQLVGSYFYFVLFVGTDLSSVIYGSTKVLILVWPALIYLLGCRNYLKIEGERKYKESLIWGFGFGLFVFAAILGIYFLFENYFQGFDEEIRVQAESLKVLDNYLIFSLLVSFIHAFLEEYYWRWFVFRGLLLKTNWFWAAILGSIAFASHHLIVVLSYFPFWLASLFAFAVGIGGFIWCFIYYRTHTLLGSWISHVFIDLAIFAVGYFILF